MQALGRIPFLLAGLLLFGLKQYLDRWTASVFHQMWSPFTYWSPLGLPLLSLNPNDRNFVLALAAVSIPFTAIGIYLTLRRLKALNMPPWLSLLFFIPAVNLIFFAFLGAAAEPRASGPAPSFKAWPDNSSLSMALAAAIAATVGIAATALSLTFFASYGWGIFLAIPFGMGLLATLLHSIRAVRDFSDCAAATLLALGICGLTLLAMAIEGGICLLMCAPLAIPLALLGVAAGRSITEPGPRNVGWHALVVLTICPAIAATEHFAPQAAEVFPVVTTITIDAPPARVWRNVVTFSELPPPTELIFRSGIAYPIRARIEGSGPGAIRYCEFSTGPFVEPITQWQEPSLLAFDVRSSPQPMRELSPYDIHPPHLDGFMQSQRGQFRLTPIDNGRRTILEGTTWYRHGLQPDFYWRLWSDWLIHKIHLRVLNHIRTLSES